MSALQLIHPGNNIPHVIADVPGLIGYYPHGECVMLTLDNDGHIIGHSALEKTTMLTDNHEVTISDLKNVYKPLKNSVHILIHARDKDYAEFIAQSEALYEKLLDSYINIGAIFTLDTIEEDEPYTCYKLGDARYNDIPHADGVAIEFNGAVAPVHNAPSVKERVAHGMPIYTSHEEMINDIPVLAEPTKSQELSNELNNLIYVIGSNTKSASDTFTLAGIVGRFIDECMSAENYDSNIDVLYSDENVEEINVIAAMFNIMNPSPSINSGASSLPVMMLAKSPRNVGIFLDKAFSFNLDINMPTRISAVILRGTCYMMTGSIDMAAQCFKYVSSMLTRYDCAEILTGHPYFYLYSVLNDTSLNDDQKGAALHDIVEQATYDIIENDPHDIN